MTQAEFATYYEQNREGAIRRLVMRGFNREIAADAVQDAATSMLEHGIERLKSNSTGAYLYAAAMNFAMKEAGVPAAKGRRSRWLEVPVGGMAELEVVESDGLDGGLQS